MFPPLKTALLGLSILCFLAGNAMWALGGFHKGWTKTSVAVAKTDEITGIEYQEYEKKFIPGVEFPLGGVALTVLFAASSLLIKIKKPIIP
jgi:hypothetical protein